MHAIGLLETLTRRLKLVKILFYVKIVINKVPLKKLTLIDMHNRKDKSLNKSREKFKDSSDKIENSSKNGKKSFRILQMLVKKNKNQNIAYQ